MVTHLIMLNTQKKKYQEYENFAKKNKLGLWKTKFEYPWVWRKKNR